MHIFNNKLVPLLLWPFSILYYLAVLMRNWAYDVGIFRSFRLDAKIVSIGNITVGGTGKTPATIHLATALQQAGFSVAILSRGYGRGSKQAIVVSAGDGPLCDAVQAGDEPYLMSKKTRDMPIVVDRDRISGAKLLLARFAPDVILLDDGFQHRRLARDVDIVLLDVGLRKSRRFLLPAGPYREPLSALKRTDFIFIASDNESETAQNINFSAQLRRRFDVPVFAYRKKPAGLFFPVDNEQRPLSKLAGVRVFALSGIANPGAFLRSLQEVGAVVVHHQQHRDHHIYREIDLDRLVEAYRRSGAEWLVTTEKDWVKLQAFSVPREMTIAVMEIAFHTSAAALDHIVDALG